MLPQLQLHSVCPTANSSKRTSAAVLFVFDVASRNGPNHPSGTCMSHLMEEQSSGEAPLEPAGSAVVVPVDPCPELWLDAGFPVEVDDVSAPEELSGNAGFVEKQPVEQSTARIASLWRRRIPFLVSRDRTETNMFVSFRLESRGEEGDALLPVAEPRAVL